MAWSIIYPPPTPPQVKWVDQHLGSSEEIKEEDLADLLGERDPVKTVKTWLNT